MTKIEQQKEKAIKRAEEKEKLSQLLIQLADEKASDRFSDAALDRKNEIFKLAGGQEMSLNKIEEIKTLIAKNLQEYAPQFPQDYYLQIFRLNQWTIPTNGLIIEKPSIVANYTNAIIYDRFSKEVLPSLQILNPYVSWGMRANKHFQWLTAEGKVKLQQYIEEAITYMKKFETWYDFRLAHATAFGLTFQYDLFIEKEKTDMA